VSERYSPLGSFDPWQTEHSLVGYGKVCSGGFCWSTKDLLLNLCIVVRVSCPRMRDRQSSRFINLQLLKLSTSVLVYRLSLISVKRRQSRSEAGIPGKTVSSRVQGDSRRWMFRRSGLSIGDSWQGSLILS